PVRKVHFPAGFFSFSPDAQHPVGGVSHRQPVGGRQCRSQLAKKQSTSAKGFLRGGSAAASLQSYHPYQRRGFCVGGCVTPNS
ncbi:MAG: hypothetical protein IKM64_08680, partial [Clostridia bacterium]|nr:hypothetical protein [Clostridia bacterium]